jgi:translation initiation factor IF-1
MVVAAPGRERMEMKMEPADLVTVSVPSVRRRRMHYAIRVRAFGPFARNVR